MVQQSAGREMVPQLADQPVGVAGLGRADGLAGPLRRAEVAVGDEGRLSAQRQAHVAGRKVGVHPVAELEQARPAVNGKGLGDPDRFGDAGHAHGELEVHLAGLGQPGHRGGGPVVRRRGQRDVAFAGE